MTLKDMASIIAKREAKLKQVSIGNIREVLAIVSDLLVEDPTVQIELLKNGQRRQKKKK